MSHSTSPVIDKRIFIDKTQNIPASVRMDSTVATCSGVGLLSPGFPIASGWKALETKGSVFACGLSILSPFLRR